MTGTHPVSYNWWQGAVSPMLKQQRHEAYYSTSLGVEIKNAWSYTYTFRMSPWSGA